METITPKRKTRKSRAVTPVVQSAPEVNYEALEREIQNRAVAELKSGVIQSVKLSILKAIRQSKATFAYVEYEGSGNSGGEHTFATDDPELNERQISILVARKTFVKAGSYWDIDLVREDRIVADAALDLCQQLIESNHRGYEDGEGGSGRLNFHPLSMTLEMECTDYFRNSKTTTRTV